MHLPTWVILIAVALNLVVAPSWQLLATTLAAFIRGSWPRPVAAPRTRFLVAIRPTMKRRGSRRRFKVVWLEYPAELFQVVVIADNCDDGTAQGCRA